MRNVHNGARKLEWWQSPTPRRDPMRGGLTSVESDMEIFCPEKYEEKTLKKALSNCKASSRAGAWGAPKGPPTALCQLTDSMTSPNDSLDVSPSRLGKGTLGNAVPVEQPSHQEHRRRRSGHALVTVRPGE